MNNCLHIKIESIKEQNSNMLTWNRNNTICIKENKQDDHSWPI